MTQAVEAGDTVLRVPGQLLIHEAVARASPLGKALAAGMADLDADTLNVLWTIHEANSPTSERKPFWDSLPRRLGTALSWPPPALAALAGTLAHEEALQARAHLRDAYDALFPMLSTALPSLFPADVFTWERYLWAVEVWYSNAVQVRHTCQSSHKGVLSLTSLIHLTVVARVVCHTGGLIRGLIQVASYMASSAGSVLGFASWLASRGGNPSERCGSGYM